MSSRFEKVIIDVRGKEGVERRVSWDKQNDLGERAGELWQSIIKEIN